LPEEWLQKAGLDSQDLLQGSAGEEQLRPALDEAIAFTCGLFEQGRGLLPWLPFRLKLQVAATLHGGQRILTAVAESETPLANRPVLSRRHWLRLAWPILRDALLPPSRPAMARP
ncbi:MAG: squalene/phytoene synthase family protein, partial [Mariprofundaceae bacterium]|nr:squalene/phytoene synthase family protein [Mariprofundaceae bacterium]